MRIVNGLYRRLKEKEKKIRSAYYCSQNTKITDLSELSHDIPLLLTNELYKPNDFYFNALNLKKYCNMAENHQLKCVIEHGTLWGNYYWDSDINAPLPAIITFGEDRRSLLEKASSKKFYSIGPYIAYAKGVLTDKQIKNQKKRLGKTLLFFPCHSTHWVEVDYNIQAICDTIKRISVDFQSIRICLYWKDILHGHHKIYQKNGFECVSAGHIYNKYFLPRLKSIIELSDLTMSNDIGTYLGYCIYMQKPFYLVKQQYDLVGGGEFKSAFEADLENRYKNTKKYYELFGDVTDKITSEQYNLTADHWGFSSVKTKEKLKEIFDECERLYSEKF